MGNEAQSLRIDLINLDIEELKINRELYNVHQQINATLPKEKKYHLRKNYKQIVEQKITSLEEKKRLLLENANKANNNKQLNGKEKEKEKEYKNNIIETGEIKVEKKGSSDENNKFSLISKSSQKSKNSSKKIVIDKINNNNNKEIISSSGNESSAKEQIIYTKKKQHNKNENINKQNEEIKNNENKEIQNKEEEINNNNIDKNKNKNEIEEDIKNNNNNEEDDDMVKEDIEENLNINEYKKKFFDKLSSLGGTRSNINKSMDNKNSSAVEELEVVGLSQNDILKDKLSEFFQGSSIESSNHNQNNSSMNNKRAKSEISGINRQMISSSKSNNVENEGNMNSINDNNYENNYEENGQYNDDNYENEERIDDTGEKKDKFGTDETIRETRNNTHEKYKEKENVNMEVNERRMLKNNRNKSYFVLEDSSMSKHSSLKNSKTENV